MAVYEYIAKNRTGSTVTGVIQADSEAAVTRSLDEKQLFPVRVDLQSQGGSGLISGGRVSQRQLGVLYGQMADLLQAGVPLLRSLETLMRTLREGPLKRALQQVAEDISGGQSLADAMAEQPKTFNDLHSAMVRAGERGGFLEQVLADLSSFLEKQDDLRSKVRGALIYPALLVVLGLGVMCFLLVSVVPKFEGLFSEQQLPLPSRVLFALSALMTDYWPVALLLGLGVVAGAYGLVTSDRGRRWLDHAAMKLPIAGSALRMVSITRFCRILGTLLSSGVPILQSLSISRDAAGSPTLAEAIEEAAENVKAGQPLNEPLRRSRMFPPEILEMIAVAEESNQMEKTLLRIADTVERRTDRQVEMGVRLIEPIILIFIAAGVGFMALGLLLPIFNMTAEMR